MTFLVRFILALSLLAALCLASWKRNAIFIDEPTLFGDTAAKSPYKSRVHNNLGSGLLNQERIKEALHEYEYAIILDPQNTDAYYGLALAYERDGRIQAALLLYQETLALDPGRLPAKRNLAMLYYESGLRDQSRREYESIIQISPNSAEAAFARKMLEMIQH
jgi:tetratricopeptide (TPR) repeat protein